MAQEEAKRMHTSRVKETISKAVEKALSDAFYIRFFSANYGLETASFHFVERIMTEMAQNDALDGVLDRIIERQKQSSTLTDACTRSAFTSFWSVHPVTKFICKSLKNSSTTSTTRRIHKTFRFALRKRRHVHHNRRMADYSALMQRPDISRRKSYWTSPKIKKTKAKEQKKAIHIQ